MVILTSLLSKLNSFSGVVFGFAALLILLGVSKGIPGIGLAIYDSERTIAIISGLVLALMAMLLRINKNSAAIDELKKLKATNSLANINKKEKQK
jgi:hypothetical protein